MAAVTVYSSPIPEKSKTDAQEGNGRREEEKAEGVAAADKALVNEQELRTLLVERWKSLTMMGWKMFLDDLSFDILEALKNVDDDK